MSQARVIDADGHVAEPSDLWDAYLAPRYREFAPRVVTDVGGRRRRQIGGYVQPFIPSYGAEVPGARPAGGSDPKIRLGDMDLDGIDVAVLFPTAGLSFGAVGNVEACAALCRAYNNWLYDYCQTAPDRLIGLAMVAQASLYDMLTESRRAVTELGFRGVILRPNPIGGRTLEDPFFAPLWSLLEELDVPLLVHEGTTQNVPQAGLDRYENFLFRHVISHPHEQQMAVLSLIAGGVLERHPRLRVGFMESGAGWLPYWLERIAEHLEYWPGAGVRLSASPDELFQRQCVISGEVEERMLPAVAATLGDDILVYASDYPHPDAIFPGSVKAFRARTDLAEATKRKMLTDNAVRLFGL